MNLNQLTVQDLTHSDIRTGKLTIEEDRFILVFPDIKDYLYEGRIIINRTSGISYWEQGVTPFNKGNSKNTVMKGICQKFRSKSL
ncbi:TPA: hypothetical protein I8034_002396 [Legionella pneumophila]|nr:hypothetical protein [Legionella pneumophila subsp. fraseri]HAT1773017.1 hypothetical protein [Legionella pneumophila]MDX1847180.1 hypothetical protein [Legionella pneumophila subsp. fraseri]HAT2136920.1 hypothetical protein [Legionella pneumophila]HAT2143070.1 hypothetical protein [Legionella pneumophila]